MDQRDPARRRDGLAVLAAGVAGYFLALGDQGPTGGLFRLAYDHVPGFVMMREPDKFAVLAALAYACGFGWGLAWLTTRARQQAARLALPALAIALPLASRIGAATDRTPSSSSWSTSAQPRALILCSSWRSSSGLVIVCPVSPRSVTRSR